MPMREATKQRRGEIVAEAVGWMMTRLDRPLRIEDVAAVAHTSKRQLQRSMIEVTGRDFRSTLAVLRMERAAELLRREPDTTVREIAGRVGYSQPAQFAKAFRRHQGVAPAEYRRAS